MSAPRDGIGQRSVEIAVALALLVAAGVVITDSLRLGAGWGSDGPGPGYFPFYIALALAGASLTNLYRALFRTQGPDVPFASAQSLRRVLAVLVPLGLYVLAIGPLGIYVSSALYIALFMASFGGYSPWKAVPAGVGVSLALFFMFERWFLVPLPKGPLETWLGY